LELEKVSTDEQLTELLSIVSCQHLRFAVVATPEIAQKVHAQCRAILEEMYDKETADSVRILYGGSVTPDSVDELMSQPDIDGALVGGASLDSEKFGRIINFKSL
jgi:triosephosphate isomerase